MTRCDDRAKRICEFRIAIMDEVPASVKKAPLIHGDIPGDLFHPGVIRMSRDPGDLNATALEVDKSGKGMTLRVWCKKWNEHFQACPPQIFSDRTVTLV